MNGAQRLHIPAQIALAAPGGRLALPRVGPPVPRGRLKPCRSFDPHGEIRTGAPAATLGPLA